MFNNTTVPWYSGSLLLRYPDQGISLAKKKQQQTPKYKRLTDGFTQLLKKVSKKNIQITCFCLAKHCPLRSHKSQLHRLLKEDIEDRSGDGKLFELT